MDLEILKIASETHNCKQIKHFTHFSKLKNPLCGDEIQIQLIIEKDKIIDLAIKANLVFIVKLQQVCYQNFQSMKKKIKL